MAQLNLTVCDVCMDPKKTTETYTVGKKANGDPKEMELCVTHGTPIDVLLGNKARPGRKAGGATGVGRGKGTRTRKATSSATA